MKLTKVVLPILLLLPLLLSAEILQFTGSSGESAGGHSIGPYFLLVDGSSTQLVCDDYTHGITIGQTWNAEKILWGDLPTADLPVYGAAFWLVGDILNPSTSPHADSQYALWRLLASAAPLPAGSAGALSWAMGQYAANPGYEGYQSLVIYRPDPRESGQEMLGLQQVPEPSTLVLAGLGLLLLLTPRLRRRDNRG
jgi:hypothetical protein